MTSKTNKQNLSYGAYVSVVCLLYKAVFNCVSAKPKPKKVLRAKETAVLCWWGVKTDSWFINRVDNESGVH